MGKGVALLGLILIIVGILPLIFPYIGFEMYASYFDLGFYSIELAGFMFTELMLILIVLGVIVLIVGAAR